MPLRPGNVLFVALAAAAALPAGSAQYVGKVGQTDVGRKPVLRATAVYQYTGLPAKPSASRLVPVVVWDGVTFQPGGLYLAQPEPLSVAPGTQYVLEQNGVPDGLFNVLSSAQQNGAWIGLGRFQKPAPPPPVAKLRPARTLPVLRGGSGQGRADADTDATGGPVLHRRAGSEGGTSGTSTGANTGTSSSSGNGSDDQPTLHRRGSAGGSGSSAGSSAGSAGGTDPDRPTLHEGGGSSGANDASAPPLDPDRPVLHERHPAAEAAESAVADPDRPHLRYDSGETVGAVMPATLTAASLSSAGSPVAVGESVAVSDTEEEEPHSFAYSWPSAAAEASARAQMHTLALRALAAAVQSTFGPAAASDAELRAALAHESSTFGPAAQSAPAPGHHRRASTQAGTADPVSDPLLEPEFRAFTLSYGGGAAWVYTAHTRADGPTRRFVTVIAEPDFNGKPLVVFSQTTRGDTLDQTPALHLIDAVDADGDHRAELLFAEQTAVGEQDAASRQFALFRVSGGAATEVYSTGTAARQ